MKKQPSYYKNFNGKTKDPLWGLLKRRYNQKTQSWTFKICWSKMSIFMIFLAALAWISLSCAVYFGFKVFKKYDEMSFIDALSMPLSMEKHRVNMGEFQIRKSEELFKAGEFQEAFLNLRNGVIRSPKNLAARIKLAQIYAILLKDKNTATLIVQDGLKEAYKIKDGKYLASTCLIFASNPEKTRETIKLINLINEEDLLEANNMQQLIVNTIRLMGESKQAMRIEEADEYAQSEIKDEKIRRNFASNAAISAALRNDYKKAFEILGRAKINSGEVYGAILAREQWASGNEDKALELLLLATGKSGSSPSESYKALYDYCKELGDEDVSNKYLRLYFFTKPVEYGADMVSIVDSINFKKINFERLQKFYRQNKNNISAVSDFANLGIVTGTKEIFDAMQDDSPVPEGTKAPYLHLIYSAEFALLSNDINTANSLLKRIEMNKDIPESMSDGMKLAILAISGQEVWDRLNRFAETNSKEQTRVLGKLLQKTKCVQEANRIAQILLEKSSDDYKNVEFSADIYYELGDISAIADLCTKYKGRISFEALNKLGEIQDSDKLIFMEDSARKKLKERVSHAKKVQDRIKTLSL